MEITEPISQDMKGHNLCETGDLIRKDTITMCPFSSSQWLTITTSMTAGIMWLYGSDHEFISSD